MSSKREQQLNLEIRTKDVLLIYIWMFKIQRCLYSIEHISHESESHLGLMNNKKEKLIEQEIATIKESLNAILDGLIFHGDFIVENKSIAFSCMLKELKDLIKHTKADTELTGLFNQCINDVSDKLLNLIKDIEK